MHPRHPATRDVSIDGLRGLAIVLMVLANQAPSLASAPPDALRWLYSLAAPLFIFLSGLMSGYQQLRPAPPGFQKMLHRSLLLLCCGIFLDVASYQIVPLVTVDVLYLLAAASPVCWWMARRSSILWLMVSIILILGFAFLARALWGYQDYPTEIELGDLAALANTDIASIAGNWGWHGWFPLLPWLAVALTGTAFARIRYGIEPAPAFLRWAPLGILVAGIAGWVVSPGEMYIRDGYAEVFYPATTAYILIALGVCLLSLDLADRLKNLLPSSIPGKVLCRLGRNALLVYVSHSLLIRYVVDLYFAPLGWSAYALTSLALLAALYGFSLLRQYIPLASRRQALS